MDSTGRSRWTEKYRRSARTFVAKLEQLPRVSVEPSSAVHCIQFGCQPQKQMHAKNLENLCNSQSRIAPPACRTGRSVRSTPSRTAANPGTSAWHQCFTLLPGLAAHIGCLDGLTTSLINYALRIVVALAGLSCHCPSFVDCHVRHLISTK